MRSMGVDYGSSVALARHYRELGQFENGLQALAKATTDEVASSEYWFVRSECLRRLGRTSDAIAAAREGLTREPGDVGLLDSLGLSLCDVDDYKNADAAFTQALAISPWQPVILGHHAVALAHLGRGAEADRAVSDLKEMAPASPVALRTAAEVAFVSGRPEEAKRAARELLAVEPESAGARIILGNVAVKDRRIKPAADAFAEAAMLNPQNDSVVQAARRTRVAAHPLLTPTRFIMRYSRGRPRLAYFAIIVALILLHQGAIAIAFFCFWMVVMVVLPRAVRFYYERKHGGF
jgi:Flp pilus assembly protein TadD